MVILVEILFMEDMVIKHSDIIVNVSDDISSNLKKRYPLYENKFHTIHNGFDLDDFKSTEFHEKNNETAAKSTQRQHL